jgi:polyhydroxybutyrate depolymerase
VIVLHGYGASGAIEESYLNLTPQSDAFGFLYAYPDGTMDVAGNRFWNATDACCNFFDAPVDDSAYLSGLIDEIEQRYDVARDQVFVVGHSNGAFMAYRMACDHGDQVSGIVSLAGAMWEEPTSCSGSTPVSVLEIHGTEDRLVPFTGGHIHDRAVPSATQTLKDWVQRNGCSDPPDGTAPDLDLDLDVPGAETTVTRYSNCTSGKDAQLWTIRGGDHIPTLTPEFAFDVASHLLGTPRSVFAQ